MTLSEEPPRSLATPVNHSQKLITLLLAFLGLLLAGILLFLVFGRSPARRVVWLTPAQFRQSTQPGPLTLIKYKIINWTGPYLRGFLRYKPQINIDSSLMTFSAAASQVAGLGNPVATNSAGFGAWILLPNELQSFQKRLKSLSGAAVLSRPRVSTANGIQSQISLMESAPAGSKTLPVGLTIDTIPKVANGRIKLWVCVISTERPALPVENPSLIQTNVAISCQTSLPSGGALVVDAGPVKAAGGTNYWFIISPTAIDARGQPIKL
jgi:hypothetical protein